MKNVLKQIRIAFDCSSEDKPQSKVIMEVEYPTTLDTITTKIALPVNLMKTFEDWLERTEIEGELPDTMSTVDVIVSQALSSFIAGLDRCKDE